MNDQESSKMLIKVERVVLESNKSYKCTPRFQCMHNLITDIFHIVLFFRKIFLFINRMVSHKTVMHEKCRGYKDKLEDKSLM